MTSHHDEILLRAADAVRERYVLPDVAARAADSIDGLRGSGEARECRDAAALAALVTRVLHETAGDPHLRLIHHDGPAPDERDEAEYARYWVEQAEATSGGCRAVERVEGNIAVVTLGPFIGLPVYAGEWQAAAMALCRGARGVVLDVRSCVGGTPDGAALICSYLFDEPVHLIDIQDADGLRQFWTLPIVPGRRLGTDVPCVVVVSGQTFSGGEELAFNLQALGRATVVGEQTRGGAHPRVGLRLGPHLELSVPVARPHDPRTGRNWEGVGVRPDIEVSAEAALDHALGLLRSEAPTAAQVDALSGS